MTVSIDQFVAQSRTIGTVAELFLTYQALLYELGFDRVCYAVTSDHPNLSGGHELGVIYDNSMSDWVQHYAQNQWLDVDPVHRQGLASPGINLWSDWASRTDLPDSQLELFSATERFGLHDGLTISVHGAGGTKTAILMASSRPREQQLTQQMLDLIELASHQFHNCYLDLMKHEFDFSHTVLSTREEEVLQWMAQGCTKAEVSEKLAMSSHTVDYHVRNILKKLDAKNTVAATAIAVQQNYISL